MPSRRSVVAPRCSGSCCAIHRSTPFTCCRVQGCCARRTALTARDLSLKDSSKRRWFLIDLDLLRSEPDTDEVVFDRAKRGLRRLDEPEVQYEPAPV
jgi:hypothetical protein